MIKAVALDVDGTITDKTRKACISAIRAIRTVEGMGIPVVIVTGNISCFVNAVSILFGTTGGFVAENGGVVEFQGEKHVLGDIGKCQGAYDFLRSNMAWNPPVEKVEYSNQRVSEVALKRNIPVEMVKDALKNFEVEVYDSKFAIHLTDPSVNKGSSLEFLAGKMGIKTGDIMAVGDSENDLDFLKASGVKVAVANAVSELKDIADYVTEKPYGDGVAEAVERFIL
ncbi:phosphoglycolate phosphatase [Methanobacterium aggregans]|uniref:phosphoglycolate phosphatase n=1 Tax=Methanobacterium aggregans TaxID=1615586 RepID=UPI001AE21EA6|nr:phosphoglycolate phosphatase (TIGR01487 family) [Methanobacterium aggregans]